MSKGILYIISGPSGTGKGTVCNELIKCRDIHLSVSATTRNKRMGETDGVTYHYMSEEEFLNNINNGNMLEWALYNENYYGTPKSKIEEMLNLGKDVMLEIEPQGALQVKKLMSEAVLIFIVPPSMKSLRERLVERGRESEEEINSRLKAAQWEFTQAYSYNHIVVNDELSKCVEDIGKIMDGHKREFETVLELLSEQ